MNKNNNISKKNNFHEPVLIPIEKSIDLHTFQAGDLPEVLEEYLNECIKSGYKEVRIIHGKGRKQAIVWSILPGLNMVKSFCHGSYDRGCGGLGATVVYLNT